MNKATFFVIDPSEAIRKITKERLTSFGLTCLGEAETATSAMELLAELSGSDSSPTYIVLDITEPALEASVLVPELREMFPESLFVFQAKIQNKLIIQRCLTISDLDVSIEPFLYTKEEGTEESPLKSELEAFTTESFDLKTEIKGLLDHQFEDLLKDQLLNLMLSKNEEKIMRDLKRLMAKNLEYIGKEILMVKLLMQNR